MRKSKRYTVYTIEEKNEIVRLYLNREKSYGEITRTYNLSSSSTLISWVRQYKKFGTCVDRRGKGGKAEGIKKGRPKTYKENLEDLSKQQLIERVKMYEDIKKWMAYLINQSQN